MEIKRELVIKSPPSKVFKAITDPQQLTQWFPDVAHIEPTVGGKISFKFFKSIYFSNFFKYISWT